MALMIDVYLRDSSYYIQRMAYYQQDTLSIASRNVLAQLFVQFISANQAIEEFRQKLAVVPRFDSLSLFRFLDRKQKGFLTEKDLQFAMGTVHRKLLTYAFSWVDIRKVGEVSRFEFASFLLPRENLQLRQANLKNLEDPQAINQPDTLSLQFGLFQGLLNELMSKEMKLIQLRRALVTSSDYSLEGVRYALNNCQRRWVCTQDILTFLRNIGFEVTSRQAEALVEAINNDGEGKVTFQQLKWMVEGLQNKEKYYLQKVKACNKKKPTKKPTIQQGKFREYLSKRKKRTCEKQQEFNSIMSRIKSVQKQQKRHENMLLQSEKSRIQSARKSYEQQILSLHLKREQLSIKKAQQREARLARHQMQLQLDHLLSKTARLQQETDRLIRHQNRLNILEDSASIKKQIQAQLCAKQYQKIVKAHRRLVFSPPSAHKELRRLSIESHIKASEEYLNSARHTHKKIMRDWKQQSLILDKQNEMGREINKKKTPGTLINKSKPLNESLPINHQPQPVSNQQENKVTNINAN